MSERKEVTRAKNEKPNYYYDERKKNIQRNRHREREWVKENIENKFDQLFGSMCMALLKHLQRDFFF